MSKRPVAEDEVELSAKAGDRPETLEFSDSEHESDYESDSDEIFQASDSEDEFREGEDMNLDKIDEEGQVRAKGATQASTNKREVWLPGTQLAKDEVLEADQSAYEMLHTITPKWPCLSFDILKDDLGDERRSYPVTTYIVTGTQADTAKHNEIQIIKASNLVKTQLKDEGSDSEDESDDEVANNGEPLLTYRAIPVVGGTNRIRACRSGDGSRHLAASMSDSGAVYLWDILPHLQALETPSASTISKDQKEQKPIHIIKSHGRNEGYAVAWSPIIPFKLATGDNAGCIYLTSFDAVTSTFKTDPKPWIPTRNAGASVEDIQWSPTEKTVFASASSDGYVRIWDTRSKGHTPALEIKVHDCDVNVLSWNTTVPYLLATGAENGSFSIWDLRTFGQGSSISSSAVATFSWHKAPITSIQWHPTDESSILVGGADDQVTIWDLSVELDAEEMAMKTEEGLGDVPSQLMFVHMGGKDVKEVMWSKQVSGLVVITGAEGFGVFKSADLQH